MPPKNIKYSEKVTKFCEISTLLLSYVVPVKSKVEISQNFVAFSEYTYELYNRELLAFNEFFLCVFNIRARKKEDEKKVL